MCREENEGRKKRRTEGNDDGPKMDKRKNSNTEISSPTVDL